MINTTEKKSLLAELHKLTPAAQDIVKKILEEFEQLSKDLSEIRSVLKLTTIQVDLPNEIWRDIEDYEGYYQVSNMGRVKSLYFGIERILKPSVDTSEYPHVTLSKGKQRKIARVHVLVAKAFLPNPENKPDVNHIDGNKLNCHLDNLEWATKSENQQHALRTGLKKSGVESPKAVLTEDQVREIRSNCIPNDKENGIHAFARKYKVSLSVIQNVIHRRTYKNVK